MMGKLIPTVCKETPYRKPRPRYGKGFYKYTLGKIELQGIERRKDDINLKKGESDTKGNKGRNLRSKDGGQNTNGSQSWNPALATTLT